MRAVIQRVLGASVSFVDKNVEKTENGDHEKIFEQHSAIENGFLVLIGVHREDTLEDSLLLADKIGNLRVMEDAEGKLNLSLKDVGGSALVVSNFTLFGDCRKGRRPSFTEAASGQQAEELYAAFGNALAAQGIPTQYGVFGAEMQVALINDGPITLLLDSKRAF